MPPNRELGVGTGGVSATPSVYEQIVAGLSSGVLAVDQEARILTANAAAESILNMPSGSFAPGVFLDQVPAAQQFVELFHELARGGNTIQRREIDLEFANGRRILGVTASALQGMKHFSGVSFLFSDLSEVRNLERRAEINRQLAQIGELTAGVVHELRNPMSVISGMAELILRRLEADHPQRKQADLIFQEAAHIEQLITQFLSFAKPFEARLVRCTAELVVERALQLAARAAADKGVVLAQEVSPGLPQFQADPPKLAQALGNLLRNAVEAVPTGGTVTLIAQVEETRIAFQVEDNGPGIHLNPGEDLLNPFFSKKEGGTGLGLNIVHRIVTAHGGTVTYGNRPAGGAWFCAALPISYGA